MRVDSIHLHHIRIPLRTPFHHALHTRRAAESVIVSVRGDDGTVGYGEIVPRPYLTGESIDSVLLEHAPAVAASFIDRCFETKEELLAALSAQLDRTGRELATWCGFELAMLDLGGHIFGFPAGEVVGRPEGPDLEGGIVIGFEVPTESLGRHCAMLRLGGKRHVKVKVGLPDDLRRLEIVFDSLGENVVLRIDANGAWSADAAIEALRPMVRFGIQSVEQPVPADDLLGMRRVREELGLPVMADESLCTLKDANRLADAQAADIFNIRLAKCGGFGGSMRLVRFAEEAKLGCHLGTLVGETGILLRAAEVFGRRAGRFACLEGKGQNRFLLEQDILEDGETDDDSTECGQSAGLGITVDSRRIARYTISERVLT